MKPQTKSIFINDLPTTSDLLGFETYVDSFSELITSNNLSTPLTIGIYGQWGSGKTSLMEMLDARLSKKGSTKNNSFSDPKTIYDNNGIRLTLSTQDQSNTEKISTIWFNAWQYAQEETLWSAFLQSVILKIPKSLSLKETISFYWRLIWKRFDSDSLGRKVLQYSSRFLGVLVPTAILMLIATYANIPQIVENLYPQITLTNLSSTPNPLQTSLPSNGPIVTFTPTPSITTTVITPSPTSISIPTPIIGTNTNRFEPSTLAIILYTVAVIWWTFKPASKDWREAIQIDFSKLWKSSKYEDKISFFNDFRSYFSDVVSSIPRKGPARLVVFIDDLDRCSSEQTIQVLDTVKLFLDVPGCVFILGLDREIVNKAASAKYDLNISVQSEYIAKIIQLPFHLPILNTNQINNYIDKQWPLLDVECKDVFVAGTIDNPRSLKRVINVFNLTQSFVERHNTFLKPLLAKIIVIQQEYPDLYAVLKNDPQLIIKIEHYFVKNRPIELQNQIETFAILQSVVRNLKWALATQFSTDELVTLCFDLQIDREQLIGNTKDSLAISLIQYVQRRNRLTELLQKVLAARPHCGEIQMPANHVAQITIFEQGRQFISDYNLTEELEKLLERPALMRMFQLTSYCFEAISNKDLHTYFTLTANYIA